MHPAIEVRQTVDHLFRRESGKMVSVLTRILGVENLDLAEDIVQEVLLKALNEWSYRAMPDNPSAWMMQAAKNKAIDHLRRNKMLESKTDDIIRHLEHELK